MWVVACSEQRGWEKGQGNMNACGVLKHSGSFKLPKVILVVLVVVILAVVIFVVLVILVAKPATSKSEREHISVALIALENGVKC